MTLSAQVVNKEKLKRVMPVVAYSTAGGHAGNKNMTDNSNYSEAHKQAVHVFTPLPTLIV